MMKTISADMIRLASCFNGKTRTEEEKVKDQVESFNSSDGTLDKSIYDCQICHNKGSIMKAIEHEGHWTVTSMPCKCIKTRKNIINMQNSGLKNIIREYTFAKYNAEEEWQKQIKEAAESYAKEPKGWFFIGGQSGAGKTHLCTAICRQMLLEGKTVKYMLWRDEAVKLKAAVNDPDVYKQMMDDLKLVDVLYIDDLFKTGKSEFGTKQKPTSADINIAFEILNFRYSNPQMLTVISSESTLPDIMDIDEAVGGRIYEKAHPAFSLNPDKKKNYRMKGEIVL